MVGCASNVAASVLCRGATVMDGSTVLERITACLPCGLPCASWPCGNGNANRNWQLWPGDFDDDAQPILTAPTPALAECLIPPSVSNLYADRGDTSPESAGVPWDISAGRSFPTQACHSSFPLRPWLAQSNVLSFHKTPKWEADETKCKLVWKIPNTALHLV